MILTSAVGRCAHLQFSQLRAAYVASCWCEHVLCWLPLEPVPVAVQDRLSSEKPAGSVPVVTVYLPTSTVLLFYVFAPLLPLPSSPTRRSSDLAAVDFVQLVVPEVGRVDV